MLAKCSKTDKTILLATGACNIGEVQRAVKILEDNRSDLKKWDFKGSDIILMQCNTNYTGLKDNFNYINLNVLNTYKSMFPNLTLGLSDHTPGHVTVLGAVALGAKVIEKHFTDDTEREGPDHPFSMDAYTWSAMVEDTRLLEASLGNPTKDVEKNEKETVVLQRRSIRTTIDIKKGEPLVNLQLQRPCPANATNINRLNEVTGKIANRDIEEGDFITNKDF
jgi:N-acetylneuraminate synthase